MPFGFVNSSTGVDLKTGALLYNPEKETQGRQGRARDLPRRAGHEGLAADGVLAEDRDARTSRIRICAWTRKACRRTTSRARRTSA